MKRPYVTTNYLHELNSTLTTRQQRVLGTVARVRLASSQQLERLHFTDVTRRQARQMLARMAHQRLLLRLPRTAGGVRAGSSGYVYTLDTAGARLLNLGGRRRRPPVTVGWPFLAHSLAVTEAYVRLVEAHRIGHLELMSFTTEPACWRTFAGPGGGRIILKPDAFLVARLGRYEDRWFVELDNDTESKPTILRKCEVYRRYWQTGTEQATTGIFPRVCWLVPDERRRVALLDVMQRLPEDVWPLFTVALASEVVNRIAQGADV